ncbi:MAG: DUF1810 domain-containing protein [Bacteroidota bacterium]|nr:DUF1810 domain-containing protein [Bacteroidota bacterium]
MKYDLDRFKTAQDSCYRQVLEEMKNGKKVSHWMWFIFPQISGLGKSGPAKKYEIANIEEAEYYLMDELLSKRLLELTGILAYEVEGRTAEQIFGFPDYLKFHSAMTLFYSVVITNRQFENNSDFLCFENAIRKYYEGKLDTSTLEILKTTTLFTNETPYQFASISVDQEDFNFRLEYVNIQPADKWKPPVGTLLIQSKDEDRIASIENAMGPLCWSSNKKIVVLPICKMHWLKGFQQKFAIINLDKRTITNLKQVHKGEPRIINKVEDENFYFKHFNANKKIVEGVVNFTKSEIEETRDFS